MTRRPHPERRAGLLVLLILAVLGAPGSGFAATPVRFQLWGADSLALYGSYFRAFAEDEPVALVLPDRGAGASELGVLSYVLQGQGMAVFLPDPRGEGESVTRRRGRVSPAPRWDAPARALLARDLEAVLAFADRQPGLETRPWVLVAEGEACALALELLANEAEAAPGVRRRFAGGLLMSPLPTEDLGVGAADVPQRLALLACDQDSLALGAVRALVARGPEGERRAEILPCRRRGVRALSGDELRALPLHLIRWLAEESAAVRPVRKP